MEPVRDTHATLVDLLDRILDKGLVINADVIISVAGIPLIGVNLRAALGGMETMLKYGVMQAWDEKIRAWEKENRKRQEVSLFKEGENLRLPEYEEGPINFLREGEKVRSRGKMWHLVTGEGILGNTWKPGCLYLTNKRLCWWYEFEGRIAFQIPMEEISAAVKERRDLSPVLKDKKVLDLIYNAKRTKAVASFSGKEIDEWEKAINRDVLKRSLTEEEERETCPRCGNPAPVRELLEEGCLRCGWVSARLKRKLAKALTE